MVGRKDESNGGAVQIYESGFRLRGGDALGNCFTALSDSDLLTEMGDPTLKFNVNVSYGCKLSFTRDELLSNCDSLNNPLSNLEIFKNLEQIDVFGQFGNAYIYYPKVRNLTL